MQPPVYRKPVSIRGKSQRAIRGIHMEYTETWDLEQAARLLVSKRAEKRRLESAGAKPRTLKQIFSAARFSALRSKKIPKRRLAPHPFLDLTPEQKRLKMREMFATGLWGLREYGCRQLAKEFDVPAGQAITWLEDMFPYIHP